jgi:hypothetical protein
MLQNQYLGNYSDAALPLLLNPKGGKVGIGTDSPLSDLHVESSGVTTIRVRSTGNTNSGFHAVDMDGEAITLGIRNEILKLNRSGSFVDNHLVIDTNGNVGINTAIPATNITKLDVNGDVRADSFGSDPSAMSKVMFPEGGELRLDDTQTGRIKIALPDITYTAAHIKGKISVVVSGGDKDFEVNFTTYFDGGTSQVWSNAWITGRPGNSDLNHDVRFAFDGSGRAYILIGEDTDEWVFPHVCVTELLVGRGVNKLLSNWNKGWDVTIGTTSGYVIDHVTSNPSNSNWERDGSDIEYNKGNVNITSGLLNLSNTTSGTPVTNLALDANDNVVAATSSNDGVTTVKMFNATPDQVLYDDGNIQIHLDDQSTDDIEVKVLTNPSSGNVQFGWWSPSDTSAGSASLNIASGQFPLNGNFGDDDTMQIRIFAPSDSSYPYWEVNITKGPSGDPLVIRVTKWASYD